MRRYGLLSGMVVSGLLLLGKNPAEAAVDLAGAPIAVGVNATDMELIAAREFQRYARLISGKHSPIVLPDEIPPEKAAILIGTADSLQVAKSLAPPQIHPEGFVWRVRGSPSRVVLAAAKPIGVQNGVYALLEELGVGFFLGGDTFPTSQGSLTYEEGPAVLREPAFDIRGSVLHFDYLNGPLSWDLEDYRYFFDQTAKMRQNFVAFHVPESAPFLAFRDDGEWKQGRTAETSETYSWGAVRGMRTVEFGFGTSRYFDQPVFGSRTATERTEGEDGIRRAQCVLAQGLQYAKERGIRTCLGFDLDGDPTDANVQALYERKIRELLSCYPMVDTIGLWTPRETNPDRTDFGPETPMGTLVSRYADTFSYLEDPARTANAVRTAMLARLAYDAIRSLRPDVGVVLSGWGGDDWRAETDFLPGFDQILPADVIFAFADDIDPTRSDHVSQVYGRLSATRRKWPVLWYESDGGGSRRDLWCPQANVMPFTHLCRDVLAKNCEGILGTHWQTRGVEEVAAYTAQFAWNPELTYEGFYDRFAESGFGPQLAALTSLILRRLESLGPRWTGGSGQVERGFSPFAWFSRQRVYPTEEGAEVFPKPANLLALGEVRAQIQSITPAANPQGLERLRYLLSTIDFLAFYDQAGLELRQAGEIQKDLEDAEELLRQGKEEEARSSARGVWKSLAASGLDRAMQAYTQRLTTQGDFGNLAVMNLKAYARYQEIERRVAAICAPPPTVRVENIEASTQLAVKNLPGVVPEGVPLVVRCTAFDEAADPLLVVLYHRIPVKEANWVREEMTRTFRNGYSLTIPGTRIGPEGVEYYIEAVAGDREPVRAPVSAPHLPFSCTTMPYRGPVVYPPVAFREGSFVEVQAGQDVDLRAVALGPVELAELTGTIESTVELDHGEEGGYHILSAKIPRDRLPSEPFSAHAVAVDSLGFGSVSDTVTFTIHDGGSSKE